MLFFPGTLICGRVCRFDCKASLSLVDGAPDHGCYKAVLGECVRVLLSAYACEPGKGSEPGVGWHWATELARLGHEVIVITRSNNRALIEKALKDASIPGLRFHYYDLPSWGRWWKRGPRGVRFYYWLWQAAHIVKPGGW